MLNIKERQNKEDILKKIFAAGKYYDYAGNLELVSFIACVINVVVSYLFPNESYMIYITTVFVFIEGMCDYSKSHMINLGAQIKNYIDRTLFGMLDNKCTDAYCDAKMVEKIDKICNKYNKKFERRKNVDGFQKGVRDWYILNEHYTDDLRCVYDCQKQNKELDKPITRWNKIFVVAISFITLIVIFTSSNIPLLFCVSLPLISKIIKNGIILYQHNNIMVSIDVVCSQINNGDLTKDKLEELQIYIEKRRYMDFSTFSVIYNIYRKKLHRITQYAVTSNDSM